MADPIPHPAHSYDIKDTTTGVAWQADGTPYDGPVAGLTNEIILGGTDNINVTSYQPNSFIHTAMDRTESTFRQRVGTTS